MTLFEKIAAHQIPASIAFEDDDLLVLHDVNPQAPVHVLIVPKKAIPRIAEASAEDAPLLAKLLFTAQRMAKELGLTAGFRIVINNGSNGGETVPHLHVHLLGGRRMHWPPG
jgi:histidine triad (HIT) family protein